VPMKSPVRETDCESAVMGRVEVFEHRTPAGLATIVDSGVEPASGQADSVSDADLLDLGQDEIDEFEAEFDGVPQTSS